MTFSHEFFKVCFPSEAVVRSVSMRPMEGTVFASIPLASPCGCDLRLSLFLLLTPSLLWPARLTFLLRFDRHPRSRSIPGHVDFCQSLAGSDSQLAVQVVFSWKTFLQGR
ncbi:unnamed protein product [Prunus brigantina]